MEVKSTPLVEGANVAPEFIDEAFGEKSHNIHECTDCCDQDQEETPEGAQEAINELNQEHLRKQMEEMISNPVIRENTLINAQDMKKRCKGWFTVEQMARKLMMQPEPVADMLMVMCLFEFAFRKEHKGVMRYKIQFAKEDKLKILHEELAEAEKNVIRIKRQILEISNN